MCLQVELRGLVPLLVMLAALPWVDPDEDDGQNVPYINHVKGFVLDAVEGRGESFESDVKRCLPQLALNMQS